MAAVRVTLFWLVSFMISAEAQTNIRPENITAEVGQDVILESKVPNNNILVTAVEWIRPHQEPEYVLFYRDGYFVPENQHPSYQNRVDLKDKDMKDGDFSLILKNVMMEDSGTYTCLVFEEGKIDHISNINLVVHLPGNKEEINCDGGDNDGRNKDRIIIVPVVIMILLLAVACLGFWCYRRHMRQNSKLPVPPDEAAAEQML